MKRTPTLFFLSFVFTLLIHALFALNIPNLFSPSDDPLAPAHSQKIHQQLQNFYRGKRVLITGGAGFIGSHLAEQLVALGAHVTILDNLSTGSKENLRLINKDVELIIGDIRDAVCVDRSTKNKNIVFHLAAFISVPLSMENPALCHDINIHGTKNVLQSCCTNRVATFVLSSSCAVYGSKNGICKEDDLPKPESPYAASKLADEQLCKQYSLCLSTIGLRYFNVYGDRQNPQGHYAAVVAKFAHNLQHHLPLTIFGDGQQTRDFVHVSHIALANLIVGMQKKRKGEIFNIGTGKSFTLLSLVNRHTKSTFKKRLKY